LIELERFGTLLSMRALSVVIVSIYLCVGASPCIGASAEKPTHSSHAEGHAHAQAGRETHGAAAADRHRHGEDLAAESKLRARCPCGCEGGSTTANSFVRLGFGLSRSVIDPAAANFHSDLGAPILEYTQALPRAVDHVPIGA
jgi:hypothetical protein